MIGSGSARGSDTDIEDGAHMSAASLSVRAWGSLFLRYPNSRPPRSITPRSVLHPTQNSTGRCGIRLHVIGRGDHHAHTAPSSQM
jgi:hypothetical protein